MVREDIENNSAKRTLRPRIECTLKSQILIDDWPEFKLGQMGEMDIIQIEGIDE